MSEREGSARTFTLLAHWGPLVIGGLLFLYVRWVLAPAAFGNSDIAGITYNADALLRGELPYRDTTEVKSPASFFVVAAVFKFLGRDITLLNFVYSLWALVGAAGVFAAARVVFRGLEGWGGLSVPSVAAAIYLVSIAPFDFNYSSWMAPAYAWAFALLLQAFERNDARRHFLAGAASICAFLFKTQALVLGLVFAARWVWGRWREPSRSPAWIWAAWTLGGAVPIGALLILYAVEGATLDLLGGLFPTWGLRYASAVIKPPVWILTVRVAWQTLELFPTAVALGSIGIARALRDGRASRLAWPAVFFAASVVGCGLGGARFYGHYAIQQAPALALLAAAAILRPSVQRSSGSQWLERGAAAAALVVGLAPSFSPNSPDYVQPRPPGGSPWVEAAGRHVQASTRPGDTIYCWGWKAWPVYFWANRKAPTPVYKELAVLTTVNTNTAWSLSGPIRFRPGPEADQLIEAFKRAPPAYFVYSNYFPWVTGGRSEPLREFSELRKLLNEQYVEEARYGDIVLLRHR